MFSICTIQFPSDAKVTPRCIWLSTSSTDSLLNRMFNSGILVLFDSIRALVLLGLKSTSLVFSHWSNISKSLFISICIKSKLFPEYDNEVSSANSFAKLPRLSVVMSLIIIKTIKDQVQIPRVHLLWRDQNLRVQYLQTQIAFYHLNHF